MEPHRKYMSGEELRDALADRYISVVADATGLHRNTLERIRRGETFSPSRRTTQILTAYFRGEKSDE
jgi:transcriptional regulator with XRE-family HTH domain